MSTDQSPPAETPSPRFSSQVLVPPESLSFLRAEREASEDAAVRASLAFELGRTLERSGDDAGAAREYLAVVNDAPDFREPLEALVALLYRRRSVKNLGKMLDALVAAASTTEETARALIEKAAFQLDHEDDVAAAKESLISATAENADDVAAWLELELIAGRTSDPEGRLAALTERAQRAEPPVWRALLLLDVAELEAKSGDASKAVETCRAAAMLEGAGRFRAYQALADLARTENNPLWMAEALEAQAELAGEAIGDSAIGDETGVPAHARSGDFVADVLVRAAAFRRTLGDARAAAALLKRAAEHLPDDLALTYERLLAVDASGDGEESARLSRVLLDAGEKGPAAASLYLRLEEDAAGRGDLDAALAALASAVEQDPGSIPARAIQLDLLSVANGETVPVDLAKALDEVADTFTDPVAKSRGHLRTAYQWAVVAKDSAAARVSLMKARDAGCTKLVAARVARLLAILTEDKSWEDSATRELLEEVPESEKASLLFLQGRSAALRGDLTAARAAWAELGTAPDYAWLARTLHAFTSDPPSTDAAETDAETTISDATGSSRTAESLDALAATEEASDVARAVLVLAARRAQAKGDLEGARARLTRALESDASDVLVATYLADLLRKDEKPNDSARVLLETAAAIEDQEAAAVMRLEAGLLLWKLGERQAAVDAFAAARETMAEGATPLLAWATRVLDTETTAGRRRALEIAAESGEDPAVTALERLATELREDGERDEATARLQALETGDEFASVSPDLRMAAALLRITHPDFAADRTAVDEALTLIEEASRGGASLAHAERVRLARDIDGTPVEAARHAAAWASNEPTEATALQWLAAAATIEDREGEAAAHRLLATFLPDEARAAEETAAAIIGWLAEGEGSEATTTGLLPHSAPTARLFNLETSPMGSDPRRREQALTGIGDLLGADQGTDALLLAAYSQLAAGEISAALRSFEAVAEVLPDDLSVWEGIRAAAVGLGQPVLEAAALARLGELCVDNRRAAAFWERAGLICLDVTKDGENGDIALEQAFLRDPTRGTAFDRLFRRVRERQQDDVLLELVARRVEVANDTNEIVKLYWERARVLRKKGDQEGALEALTNVTLLEPDHVGALALSGEVYIKKGMWMEAAETFGRLAEHDGAPAQQRLISGVAAADISEKRLGDAKRALALLVGLHTVGLSTAPVRERIAALALRNENWPTAASTFALLMNERDTSEGRIDAARHAMRIYLDRLDDQDEARAAVRKLLDEDPRDGEALEVVLKVPFDAQMRAQSLLGGKRAIVEHVRSAGLDADEIQRLGDIARATNDSPLLQGVLGTLVSLGRDIPGLSEELAALDLRVAKVPQIQIDSVALARINDPEDTGPITRLFELLGPTIGEALGPTKETLGVGRKERVDAKSGLPLRNEVAAWAGALGVGEFELYVGGSGTNRVQGAPCDGTPAIVVGAGVPSPINAAARQAIAREVFAIRRGITVVRTRDEATVASIVVAACNIVKVPIQAPAFATLGDVQRQLDKALPRKIRNGPLPDLCRELAANKPDLRNWAKAAQRSLDRMAAVAAGDVSLVLSDVLGVPRGDLERAVDASERATRLLRFVLSPAYLELRGSLGMGVR
jgi:cellulose synthase operon protein C